MKYSNSKIAAVINGLSKRARGERYSKQLGINLCLLFLETPGCELLVILLSLSNLSAFHLLQVPDKQFWSFLIAICFNFSLQFVNCSIRSMFPAFSELSKSAPF